MASASEPVPSPSAPLPALLPARALLIVLVCVAAAAFAARLIPEPRTIDDAFITFRYSRNIVDGNGFVYNPGARTLGTTTPLYTLLMTGIALVTGSENYPWFALVINALADACTAVLLALLMFRLTRRLILAAIIGGLWAINPMSVTFAVGGMETSVGILWAVAAVSAYVYRRPRWMALFAALGILTRIDTLIWVGPLLLHEAFTYWRETRGVDSLLRRLPWPSWGIFAGVLAPWYLFSAAYFGTLLSRSLSVKRAAYAVDGLQAFTRFAQHLATPFFEHHTLGSVGIMIGIVLYPALAVVGTVYAARRHPRLLPYLLYVWIYTAMFCVMNPLIFRWYLAPILPAYFLAILLGVWALVEAAAQVKTSPPAPLSTRGEGEPVAREARSLSAGWGGGVMLSLIGIAWGLLSLNAWVLHPDHGPDRPAPDMAWHKIELNYRQMGETLRATYGVSEDTLVAAGDIGALGFFSRARILDTVGLVTPEISRYYPLDKNLLADDANYAVPPAIIFDYRPDYLVLMESFVRNGLALDPRFDDLYAQVGLIPTDYYGNGMLLYQRRDLAGP